MATRRPRARSRSADASAPETPRYTVVHAFPFVGKLGDEDDDETEHWITTGTAHKVADLPKDLLAEKIAAGHIIDHEADAPTAGESAE